MYNPKRQVIGGCGILESTQLLLFFVVSSTKFGLEATGILKTSTLNKLFLAFYGDSLQGWKAITNPHGESPPGD